MRTDPYGGEQVVSPHTALLAQRVSAVIALASDRLDDLVRAAGLNPALDLRFGDWHGLDLSGADLRGFDFTGADLTDACFDGALIAGANFDDAAVGRASLSGAVDFEQSGFANPVKNVVHLSNDAVAVALYVVADRSARATSDARTMDAWAEAVDGNLALQVEAIATHSDRNAFAELYDYFAPRIHGFFLRSGLDASVAEDLVQEVMTKLWQRAHQFDKTKSPLATWLFRIARNAHIDYLRRQRGEAPLGDGVLSIPDESRAPDDAVDGSRWEERVRTALSKLPAEQLAIVKLAFFDGLSHTAIAKQTGLPLGTVKARIRLALTRLRRGLLK